MKAEVLDDIFGKRIGSVQVIGLVDSCDIVSFQEKLNFLERKWRLHDLDDDGGPLNKFCDWFRTNIEKVICITILLPVRERAVLGSPSELFFTSSSECINNVLKGQNGLQV